MNGPAESRTRPTLNNQQERLTKPGENGDSANPINNGTRSDTAKGVQPDMRQLSLAQKI